MGDELLEAVRKDDGQEVNRLLDQGFNVNSEIYLGETTLHVAVNNGHTELVTLLLDQGAEVEKQNYYGETPLHVAVNNGHTELVTLLLNRGADVKTQDIDGDTPLLVAVYRGHTALVTLLLDRGADVETQHRGGHTPLHVAVNNGLTELVTMLLNRGADVETKDSDGKTPLEIAVQNGKVNITKILLDARNTWDPARLDNLLKVAEKRGKPEIVSIIKEYIASHHEDVSGQESDTESTKSTNIHGSSEQNYPHQFQEPEEFKTDKTLDSSSLGTSFEEEVTGEESQYKQHNINENESEPPSNAEKAIEILQHIEDQTLILHGRVTFVCEFKIHSDIHSINWYHDGNLIAQRKRYRVSSSDGLSVLTIDDSQLSDHGEYKCVVTEQTGNEILVSTGNLKVAGQDLQQYQEIIKQLDVMTENNEKAKKEVTEKIENVRSAVTKMDNVADQINQLADTILSKLDQKKDEIKSHIDTGVKQIENQLHDNTDSVKEEIAQLTTITTEKLREINKTSEANNYIYYKMSQIISRSIGSNIENVHLWKKLAERLFDKYPPSFMHRKIYEIDQTQASSQEKAFEVLIYWKTFSVDSRISILLDVIDELGLQQTRSSLQNILETYEKDKEIDHSGSLTEQGLLSLAGNIGDEWMCVGGELGLEKSLLEQFQLNYPTSIKTAIWTMLLAWRNSTEGTVEEKLHKLNNALVKQNRNDLAQTLHLKQIHSYSLYNK